MPLEDASYMRETGEGLALRKVTQMTRISLTFGGPWLKGPLRERPGSSSQSSVPSHAVALAFPVVCRLALITLVS